MKKFRQYLTELQHFSDLISKQGNKFLNNLLNKKVLVSLKVDQSSLVLKKDGGVVKYYGREGGREIDMVKRLGMDIYEKPINHLESTDLRKLPDGVEISMEFFDSRFNTLIKYKKPPKNGIILLLIKKGGTILPLDDPMYRKVADILEISPPPLLFSGKLDAAQKQKLIDFVETPDGDARVKKFGHKKFVDFVLSLFIFPDEIAFLKTDKLEGLVFVFDGKEQVMAKVVDPAFTAGIKDKQQKQKGDDYINAVNSVVYDTLPKIQDAALKIKANSYVDFIVKLTDLYRPYAKKELGKFDKDLINSTRFSRINMSITPKAILSLIDKEWWMEDVFRGLLFSFQKEAKRANPSSGLTKDKLPIINNIVQNNQNKGIM